MWTQVLPVANTFRTKLVNMAVRARHRNPFMSQQLGSTVQDSKAKRRKYIRLHKEGLSYVGNFVL